MAEFLHMGGYGAYVWSAYGIAALVLIVNAVLPGRAERAALRRLARLPGGGSRNESAS